MAVESVGGVPVLSWSGTANGYALESATDLTTAAWSAVTNPPSLIAGRLSVAQKVTGRVQFFRLRPP